MKTPPEARDGPAVPRAPRTRAQAHLPAQAGENATGTARRMKTAETCENLRPRARNGRYG